jgi:hypothetical protein
MRRSITFATLAVCLSLFLVGASFPAAAMASPGSAPAVQGRAKKKHHRPKSHSHARPKPAKSSSTTTSSSSKKNDRGFEL